MTTATQANSFLERAKALLERGFSTIPLQPRGKGPIGPGATGRSRDINVVKAWDQQWPDANVGVCADDSITILESDDAAKLRSVLAEMGIALPETLTGGASENRPHWFYRRSEACGGACITVPGLFEFRNKNQYVVGPGSVHPSGALYKFWNNAPIVELPAEVIKALRELAESYAGEGNGHEHIQPGPYAKLRHAYLRRCEPSDLLTLDLEISEGERHYTLMSLAGLLHDGERSADEIAEILRDVQDAYFSEGKADAEIENLAAYAVKGEPFTPEPRELETWAIGTVIFRDAAALGKWVAENHKSLVIKHKAVSVVQSSGSLFVGDPVEGSDHDFVLNPLPSGNDGWFPRGDVSLIAGSSGAGKTTVMVDLLEKQLRGEKVYDHTTNGLPYLVVMADRSPRSLNRTLHRMRVDPKTFPHAILHGSLAEGVAQAIIEHKPAIVFVEGVDLLGDSSDGRNVSSDLGMLGALALHYHVAIIGSTGCPKMKPKEQYTGLRDRIIGSQVWSRRTETVVVLQKENGQETDEVTVMSVLPRNDPPEQFRLVWDRGRYREQRPEETAQKEANAIDEAFLAWVTGQDEFSRPQINKRFPKMSGRTLNKRLQGLQDCGLISLKKKGSQEWFVVRHADEPLSI